jgi:hypothetical protein
MAAENARSVPTRQVMGQFMARFGTVMCQTDDARAQTAHNDADTTLGSQDNLIERVQMTRHGIGTSRVSGFCRHDAE